MTQNQFRATLDRLGLTQVGIARMLGGDERTFRRYALGEAKVPTTLAIILRLLELGRIGERDILEAKALRRRS
jgi:hypothetical protein